jgi:hypothetical protein
VKWLEQRESRLLFVASAMMWGVVGATKLSLALTGPAFALLFVPPFNKERLKEGLKYLWYMFLGYFWIGFPQNIVLDRPVRFMLTQNKLSVAPTMDSFKGWLDIFFAQSWKLVLAVLFVTLAMPAARRVYRLKRAEWWRLLALVVCPVLVLLPRKILVPWQHYAIPIVALAILLLAIGYARVRRFTWAASLWTVAIPFVIMFLTVGSTPAVMSDNLHSYLKCRQEDRAFYAKMVELGKSNEHLWVDPYVPYDTTLPETQQQVDWFKTWDKAQAKGVTGFALNHEYTRRYTTPGSPDHYTKTENPDWRATQEFYMSFKNDKEAVSPRGERFKKVYADSCEHEIWLKSDQ